jgi:hypothetical protein
MRIARELLLESVTLGLLGGAAGVGVAYAGLRLLTAIGPQNLPRLSEIALDGWSLGFTLILSVLSGLLFGLVPVLRYAPSRQGVPLTGEIRTTSVSRERQRGRNLLVVAQVAMALVLLISAVLMVRTFYAMRNVDPGFRTPRRCRWCAFRFQRRWFAIRAQSCRFKTASRISWPQFPGFCPRGSRFQFR